MEVNYIHENGVGTVNEDTYLIQDDLFGVFDGATSFNKYIDEEGKTGGLLAAEIARDTFAKNNDSLKNMAITSNSLINKEMIDRGIDVNDKLSLWCTTVAAVKINKEANTYDWVQITDSLILEIREDGSHRLVTDYHDHDFHSLRMLKRLSEEGVVLKGGLSQRMEQNPELNEQILNVRYSVNADYGVLTGEPSAHNWLKTGTESLEGVKDIIMITDGLIIPTEDPKEKQDFSQFVQLYKEGGLEKVQEYMDQLQKVEDPDCVKYIRLKPYDDATGISITF